MIRLLLLLALFQITTEDVYYVTFIKGNVRLSGASKSLSVGDKFRDMDKMVFSGAGDKVACISPTRGRFDLSPGNTAQKVQREWIAVIKNILVQASSDHPLSTRDITEGNNDPAALFKSSLAEKQVLLIENEPVKINAAYLLDNNNFFFVKYTANGNTVVKKVPSGDGSISFNAGLFSEDSRTGLVSLCYQEMKDGVRSSKVIVKFEPVLLGMEAFQQEVELLKENLQSANKGTKEINDELYNHFYTNYGHVDPFVFKRMIL